MRFFDEWSVTMRISVVFVDHLAKFVLCMCYNVQFEKLTVDTVLNFFFVSGGGKSSKGFCFGFIC